MELAHFRFSSAGNAAKVRWRFLKPQRPMHLRLWHRLAIAFAALSIAALLAFAWLQQQSLQHGFLDYINRLSLERLAEPAQHLGEQYAQHGNWQFARGNERVLLRALGLTRAKRDDDARPRRGEGELRPPREPGQGSWRDQRRRELQALAARRPAAPLDLAQRLLLLDADGKVVSGNPRVPRDSPSIIIRSDGRPVGSLLLQSLPRLSGGIEMAFARDQLRHAGVAALLVLVGALLASLALARWLLAPIRELSRGTQALAAGDYSTRLASTRRDEFGALSADFNRLASALDENQKSRQQWGADIAHELRTPISILHGEIQALQDGVRQPGPETLASLQVECARLAALVEDLYDLSLSDAGALAYRLETLDLAELLRDTVAAQENTMRDAGLDLSLALPSALPMTVRGDRQRLAQLFGNLLGNARRYTDAPGRVRVEVAREAASWRVTLDDTAPGVPSDALERVFDRLYRVEPSRSRAFGGAGLGLSICRNIVNAHGGQIDASASPLGGLRISVLLPAAQA